MTYRIANWESFETCETKKLTYLKWVPVPNKHDGLGFRRMAAARNRCELFAAWNLILQVASKGRKDTERGLLIRGQTPLTAQDLALMTGFPVKIFEDALRFFSDKSVGWLVVDNQPIGKPPDETGETPGETGGLPAEGKEGIEGNGREKNGIEWTVPPNPLGGDSGSLRFPESLSGEVFKGAWGKWVAFRRKLKKVKDGDSMFQGQLDWLGTFTEAEAIEILNQSIRQGWQGLFPLKHANGSTNGHSKPLSISDMRSIIQAKETKCAEIRRRYCSEVSTGDTWSDFGKRKEHSAIKREIKDLNERISSFK